MRVYKFTENDLNNLKVEWEDRIIKKYLEEYSDIESIPDLCRKEMVKRAQSIAEEEMKRFFSVAKDYMKNSKEGNKILLGTGSETVENNNEIEPKEKTVFCPDCFRQLMQPPEGGLYSCHWDMACGWSGKYPVIAGNHGCDKPKVNESENKNEGELDMMPTSQNAKNLYNDIRRDILNVLGDDGKNDVVMEKILKKIEKNNKLIESWFYLEVDHQILDFLNKLNSERENNPDKLLHIQLLELLEERGIVASYNSLLGYVVE